MSEPKLTTADPVVRAMKLLEWARERGYRIGPTLQVGDVIMQINDLRQAKLESLGPSAHPEPSVEEMYGATEEPAEGTTG